MKDQKGMGHLSLILAIVIIIVAIALAVLVIRTNITNEKNRNYETNMLLIQGKVKVLSQESTVQNKTDLLKGRKLSDYADNEEFKPLFESNTISKEEEDFAKYYIIDSLDLSAMGLNNISVNNGYYIVNYDTYEIIYSKGILVSDSTIYKLSELQAKIDKNENVESNQELANEEV